MSHLLDTSVVTRVSHAKPDVLDALEALRRYVGGANIARCAMTDLEYGFSAENERQWDLRASDLSVYKLVDVDPIDFHTALDLQRELAKSAGCEQSRRAHATLALLYGKRLAEADRQQQAA